MKRRATAVPIALALCLALIGVPAYGAPEADSGSDALITGGDSGAVGDDGAGLESGATDSGATDNADTPDSSGATANTPNQNDPLDSGAIVPNSDSLPMRAPALPAALESYEIEISTYEELVDVITNSKYNNITTVYLKNNLAYGVGDYRCNPERGDLTIVGHPKNDSSVRYAIRDRAGTYLRPKYDGQRITLKDMDIYGYNYYGSFNFDTGTNSFYELDNVNYYGCQVAFMYMGTVIVRNTNIVIDDVPPNNVDPSYPGAQDPRGEAFEARSIEFYGNCSVKKISGDLALLAILNDGNSTERHFTVHEGANVSLENQSPVSPYGIIYIYDSNTSTPNLTIEKNASLNLVGNRISFDVAHMFNNITLGTNASLTVNQNGWIVDGPVFSVKGNVMLDEGSVLDLRRPANYSYYGLIHSNTDNKQIIAQNPKRVILADPDSGPPGLDAGALSSTAGYRFTLSGSTEAINTWTNYNMTDAIDNTPGQAWNKQDGGALHFSAEVNGLQTTAANISNLADEDFSTGAFDTGNFAMQNIQLLTMGSYTLTTDELSSQSTVISGSAEPHASLNFDYVNAGAPQNYSATATAGGSYMATIPDAPIEAETVITTRAYSNYLHYQRRSQVVGVHVPENLTLSVPQVIDFGFNQLPSAPHLYNREDDALSIVITDSRRVHTPWNLEASLSEPLSATSEGTTYTLPNALVYLRPNAQQLTLSDVPVSIHSATTDSSNQTVIDWDEDTGVLLYILPGEAKADLLYNARIQWTLSSAP